jgi:PBSX family phage terminase large subunit
MTEEIEISLLPKQRKFFDCSLPEVMYSGSFRAGKTRSLCIKALYQASHPGNSVGLFRKHLTSLKATTLRTLLEPDGNLPPVLPEGCYTHNKNDHIIRLNAGGTIQYAGFEDEMRVASMNLGFVAVDEAVEMNEEQYIMLSGRLSSKAAPYRQIALATNPGPPSHFLYKRFFEDSSPRRAVIQTCSSDNPTLPDDYIARLDEMTGVARARYVEGRWVGYEGLVYEDITIEDPPAAIKTYPRVMGIDAGFHHPAAIVLAIGEKPAVIDEYFGTDLTSEEMARRCKDLAEKHQVRVAYVDPSAPDLITILGRKGVRARKAENDILAGIQSVIAADPIISPKCRGLVDELRTYRWKKSRDGMAEDKPVKEYDHGCDALRYAIHSHARKTGPGRRLQKIRITI